MNAIISMIMSYSGANALWAKLDGMKTKLAALAAMLTGTAGLITEFVSVYQVHDWAKLALWAKAIPNDPSWLLVMSGLGLLGLGHKLEKLTGALSAGAAAPASQAATAAAGQPAQNP